MSDSGPAVYSRFLGRAAGPQPGPWQRPGHAKTRSTAKKGGEREASAATEERNSEDCTDGLCGRHAAGTQRTGSCQDLNLGLPRGDRERGEGEGGREREGGRGTGRGGPSPLQPSLTQGVTSMVQEKQDRLCPGARPL